jgi:deoxyribonuclease IV
VLIGAHVSPSGGLARAVARGADRKARAIQIFSQNPRQWKPRDYPPEEIEAYREAAPAAGIDALLIHAVYLLNCASEDRELRAKTLASLAASLRAGAALGATAVVLHPGSALRGGETAPAIPRAGATIAEALASSDGCALHLENTAGAGGTLGRSFDELAALLEAAGAGPRLGICLDSCHLLASGYDVRTADGLAQALDDADRVIGLDRLGSLHLNDSVGALGSNRDRHANVGEGELGRRGCAAFLSEPRFEGLACVLETPGDKEGTKAADVALARELRTRGLRSRRRR